MDRATRDKFASGTDQRNLAGGNATWETPPAVFAALHEAFHFDVDLCADAARALLPVWLGPGSRHGLHAADALQAPWRAYGARGFANPPYGRFVASLLVKARREARAGFLSLLLLPVRMTKAFHENVLVDSARILVCDKRLTFFEHGAPRLNDRAWRERGRAVADPALFDSMLVIFEPSRVGRETTIETWRVPPHVTKADLDRAAEARRARELAAC
jgi:hypothetical protein